VKLDGGSIAAADASRVDTAHGAEPYTREIAERVFAHLQPDGGWCLSNAGFIHAEQVILVDTAATLRRTALLRDAVLARTCRLPDLVINTHFHGDHTFGNQLFADQAAIIASRGTRRDITASGLHLTSLWPEVEWGDISVCPPSVCFDDQLTIYAGDLRVDLLRLGPAHTSDDTVVWLPEARVLFAGDLLMAGVTPFCMMGSIVGSLAAVERLRALDPMVIVPGHGPVGGPELLTDSERYLRLIQCLAAEGLTAGLTPLETAHAADLGPFADFLDVERLVPNLYRAYREVQGRPQDEHMNLPEVFREMSLFRQPVCRA
jgi:cyclase